MAAEFFPGTRFILEAYYPPNIARYTREHHATQEQADASRIYHNAAGANVQVSRHYWKEHIETAGWYPAPAGRA